MDQQISVTTASRGQDRLSDHEAEELRALLRTRHDGVRILMSLLLSYATILSASWSVGMRP